MKITVTVKPGSKSPGIETLADGSLVVRVRERPVDGSANDAVVKALASHYNTAPSHINLLRGHSSRLKLFEIG